MLPRTANCDTIISMKTRLFFAVLLSVLVLPSFARPPVQVDSYYRLWGEVVLRSRADFSAEAVRFVTLNHEGGLPVKVLEAGTDDVQDGATGTWFLVMTTGWTWAQDESRVPQYGKFWVFLRDDERVQFMR